MPGWGGILLKGAWRTRAGGMSWQQRGTAGSQLCEQEHGHLVSRNSSSQPTTPSLKTSEQERHWPATAGPAKATPMFGGWSTCPVRRGWGSRPCSPWRKNVLLGHLRAALQHQKVVKNMCPGSPLSCMVGGSEKRGTSWKGRCRLDINNTVSPHNPAVTRVAQKGAFSFLGSFSRSAALTLHLALLWAASKTKDLVRSLPTSMQWDPVGKTEGRGIITNKLHIREVSCSSSMCGLYLLAFYIVWSTAELRIVFKRVLRAAQYKISVFYYYSVLVSCSQCFRGLWVQSWCCWSSQSFFSQSWVVRSLLVSTVPVTETFCLLKLPVARTGRNTSPNLEHLVTVFSSVPAHNCLVLPALVSVGISVEGTAAGDKLIS